MEIKQAITEGIKELKENDIEDSVYIAKTMMAYALNKPKEYLIINDRENVSCKILDTYSGYIKKIIEGYPLQYITNHQEFMKLDFYVDENVLIPQPDTEILVEKVIEICKKNYKKRTIKILDLCTGSGAIAISIKKYLDETEITASDISSSALRVAQKNAKLNDVKIKFIKSDMFQEIKDKYDIIVSNPPYIEKKVLSQLSKDVQNEPILALDGGYDGLDFYRKISKNAYKYLSSSGYLALEIGYNQKNDVTNILKEQSKYKDINTIKDLANNDRVIIAKTI